jgi:hypothetical protein
MSAANLFSGGKNEQNQRQSIGLKTESKFLGVTIKTYRAPAKRRSIFVGRGSATKLFLFLAKSKKYLGRSLR